MKNPMKNNVFTKILCLFICMGVMLWVSYASWAADYYVDAVNGLDEPGRGTPEKPWKTITYALLQISGTGHSIHVAEGDYREYVDMKPGVSLYGGYNSDFTERRLGMSRIIGKSYDPYIIKGARDTILDGFTIDGGYILFLWIIITCEGVSSMTISHNIILGGDLASIELISSSPTIMNNVLTKCMIGGIWCKNNSFPTIENNIFFENLDPGIIKDGTSVPIVKYNNFYETPSGYIGRDGNISVDPLFVDADNGDYHLQSAKYGHWTPDGWSPPDPNTSPCIDAGDPNDDYSYEPEPNGGRIDQGAYGNTCEATRSDVPPPTPHYVSPSGKNIPPYDTPEKAAHKIQDAIDYARSGETVYVAEGTYNERVKMKKEVALYGGYDSAFTSPKPGVYKSYIVWGGTLEEGDTVVGADDTGLDGFVIDNTLWYACIKCDGVTSMRISHNILTEGDNGGIDLRASSPTIVNNVFAYTYPVPTGVIRCMENSSPIIENNIFFENDRIAIEHDETSAPIVKYNDFYGNWDDNIYAGVNGNISEDPLFVNPQRPDSNNPESYDFRLQPGSPCIDAGNPESDFCNEPQPNGCRINMGAYGNTPEATTSDTQCGDVSGDGKVSAYDAALVLRYVVELEELTQDQIQRADVSRNGAITSYDAALILRYTVGLINDFPVESCSAAPILAMNKSYEVALASVSAKVGDRITLPIHIADATSIFAGELTLDYNSTILKPINFSTTDLTKEYSLVHNAEAGKLKISFAGLESLRGSGNLVNMEFEVMKRSSDGLMHPLTLSQLRLNEGLKVNVLNGSVEILPSKTRLLPNFPNPFNPETWLPYQLASEGFVTIRIYNTKGQLIRTLNRNQPAGMYITKDKAAYWDGKDNFGEKVASNVYFYTLQAGKFKATRRMVVMK